MLSKPTAEELAEAEQNEPVYKMVAVRGNRLISLWVRGTERKPAFLAPYYAFTLYYKPGFKTSDGKFGVWCCKSLAAARRQTMVNGNRELCRIFKAYPLGAKIRGPVGWWDRDTVLYPAIILGSEPVEEINLKT